MTVMPMAVGHRAAHRWPQVIIVVSLSWFLAIVDLVPECVDHRQSLCLTRRQLTDTLSERFIARLLRTCSHGNVLGGRLKNEVQR
jgi:hypothetical protein